MNRQGQLIEILKSEGLRIVDEEGFPFESEIENDEAWSRAIDGLEEDYSDCFDNEDAWEKKAIYEENARLLRRYDKKRRFCHRSRGIHPLERLEEFWIDPAGGIHSWDEEDPARMYE